METPKPKLCKSSISKFSPEQLEELRETGEVSTPITNYRPPPKPIEPAPPKTAKERLAICDDCPALTRGIFGQKKCKVCGCAMTLKTAMKYAKCPMGRW